jgi:hypothetical protein
MNLSHGALFRAAIDANAIAYLQHFRSFHHKGIAVQKRVVAAKEDLSFSS